MLDAHVNRNIAFNSTTTVAYGSKSDTNPKVIRKFISPAVYVETIKSEMPPFKKSPVYQSFASDDESCMRSLRVKRCVCSTDKYNCPCHPKNGFRPLRIESACNVNIEDPNGSSDSLNSDETECTKAPLTREDFKLSLASLTTNATFSPEDDKRKEVAFKAWVARKEKERQLKHLQKEREELEKKIRKEQLMQQERENFRNWLAQKKIREERQKIMEEKKKLREEHMKEEEKKIKQAENEARYQDWLRRKEKADLEKKIKEKMRTLKSEEEKQKRLEESAKSYEAWLKSSKYKPKPLPLNRGLDTLRSSVSVTYINPTPWVPNVENKCKPNSQ